MKAVYPNRIIEEIAAAHGLTVAEIKGPRRLRRLYLVRLEMIKALHEQGLSGTAIARWMNRDHTVVLKYLRRMKG